MHEMNWKNSLAAIVLVGCVGVFSGCMGRSHASHPPGAISNGMAYERNLAGYKIKLVAVMGDESGPQLRLADHAWTPDGFPYEGPEARLRMRSSASAPGNGNRRWVDIELQQPQSPGPAPKRSGTPPTSPPPPTDVDAYAYLPKAGAPSDDTADNPASAGPATLEIWHGIPRDSSGNVTLSMPTSVTMGFNVSDTGPQPVVVGLALGEFKVIAQGPVSVASLGEGETATIASGSWGRLEGTHLRRPWAQSKPSPTHCFRLLGGIFPPKTERKVLFYDASGRVIAHCGDGPNNAGYAGPAFFSRGNPADVMRFEVEERPYEFVQFDSVCFDAPDVKGYAGEQGLDHAIDSPVGKVLGVLKSIKDGAWIGQVLYAADGTRWIDPGQEYGGYEYGQFDPWNHPLDDHLNILLQPVHEFSTTTTPITCEVYAADSPDGPRKEQLTSWNESPFRMPMTFIPCKPTTRPYMRIEMRIGTGTWRTLETIPVTDHMRMTAESGSPGSRFLEVMFDDSGEIRIWRDQGENPVVSPSRWHKGEQRIRAIAHKRDGAIAVLDFNMSGYGGSPGNERRYRGFEYTRQLNGTSVQSGFNSLDAKDIASFELQVEDLKPAITIPVHSPVD